MHWNHKYSVTLEYNKQKIYKSQLTKNNSFQRSDCRQWCTLYILCFFLWRMNGINNGKIVSLVLSQWWLVQSENDFSWLRDNNQNVSFIRCEKIMLVRYRRLFNIHHKTRISYIYKKKQCSLLFLQQMCYLYICFIK